MSTEPKRVASPPHLPAQLTGSGAKRVEVGAAVTLDELEAEHIRRVLAMSPPLDVAAATPGIDPSTLWRKRKRAEPPEEPT